MLSEDPLPELLISPPCCQEPRRKTCAEVFADFLFHCQMRIAMNDMAYSTFNGYRKILDNIWKPKIGDEWFEEVVYSRLATIAAERARWHYDE